MSAPTPGGIDPWTGFCGNAIRLRNRRMLVRTLWLAAVAVSFVWLHPHVGDVRYWSVFFDSSPSDVNAYFADQYDRNGATSILCVSGVFVMLAVWAGCFCLLRSLDFMRHPFARKLALRGPVELVAAEIDGQYAVNRRIGPVRITAGWLLLETRWKVVPMRHADIVWVFRQAFGAHYVDPIILDRYGERIKPDYLTFKGKDRLLARVFQLAPQAIRGYDDRCQALWKACVDKSDFPNQVRRLYPDRATDEVAPLTA